MILPEWASSRESLLCGGGMCVRARFTHEQFLSFPLRQRTHRRSQAADLKDVFVPVGRKGSHSSSSFMHAPPPPNQTAAGSSNGRGTKQLASH